MSLRTRFSALVALLAIAMTVVVTLWQAAAREAGLSEEHIRKARLYARLLGQQLEPAIGVDGLQTAREAFDSVRLDADVTGVALYREDGTIFAGSGAVAPHWRATGYAESVVSSDHQVEATAPVDWREGRRGTVLVVLSTARLEALQAHAFRRSVGVSACATGLMLIFAWVVAGVMGARLGRIAEVATRVANGDLTGVGPAPGRMDEIGRLTAAFNAMLTHVQRLVREQRERAASEQERLGAVVATRTQELEDNVRRYKALVETSNAVPWEFDVGSSTLTYVAPRAAAWFGCSQADLVAPGFLESCIHPDDLPRIKREVERLVGLPAEKQTVSIDYRFVTRDGRLLELRSVMSFEAEDGLVRGVILDITQTKKLEADLSQAQKLESVGRLASGVAHEINTPIQFVGDSVHFLKDAMADLMALVDALGAVGAAARRGPVPEVVLVAAEEAAAHADLEYLRESVPKAFDRSLDGLGRVTTIVASMKEFAHPDSREKTTVDLNRAIASTLTIARNEYKYVADVETSFGELPPVPCHAGEFNQAVLNVVVNAAHAIDDVFKATDRRGRITVSTALDGAEAVIRIKDTGGGIPAAVQPRIFDPFFTTKPVGRGTGQGLAIARSVIVDRHGGKISFTTEAGVGTTFELRLPAFTSPARQEAA